MRDKWLVGAAAVGAALLWANGAMAAEPPVHLTWQAPPECPQREAVLEQVYTMLGASSSKLLPGTRIRTSAPTTGRPLEPILPRSIRSRVFAITPDAVKASPER